MGIMNRKDQDIEATHEIDRIVRRLSRQSYCQTHCLALLCLLAVVDVSCAVSCALAIGYESAFATIEAY